MRVEFTETQVGLLSENGALVEVLAPAARRLYWEGQVDVGVEVIDIAQSAEVPSAVVARFVQAQLRGRAVASLAGVLQVQVPEHGSAEGDRPMSIVWNLQTPLPARLFRKFSLMRGV